MGLNGKGEYLPILGTEASQKCNRYLNVEHRLINLF